MLCKNCKNFDTIPGMKWGVCDKKRDSGERPHGLIKGPNWPCSLKTKPKEEIDGRQD